MGVSARIAWRQKTGSVGALLNHTGRQPVRNHERDNIRALRQKERQLREQRLKEESSTDSPFKLKQFENVPSRLHEVPARQRPSSPSKSRLRSSSTPVLISFGTRVSNPAGGATPESSVQSTPVKRSCGSRCPATPDKGAQPAEDSRGTIDIDEFKRAAEQLRRFQPPRRIPARDAEGRPTRLGQSGPADSSAEQVDKAAAVTVPPGYRLMPEAERVETLEALRQKLIDLDRSYARLPLKIETEGKKQQQQSLREKIAETENAVKLFSRPRVLIEV